MSWAMKFTYSAISLTVSLLPFYTYHTPKLPVCHWRVFWMLFHHWQIFVLFNETTQILMHGSLLDGQMLRLCIGKFWSPFFQFSQDLVHIAPLLLDIINIIKRESNEMSCKLAWTCSNIRYGRYNHAFAKCSLYETIFVSFSCSDFKLP